MYSNPTDKFLELEYHFPVDPDSCHHKFAAEFGSKKIEAAVKEKEQAEKEYTEAVQEGR